MNLIYLIYNIIIYETKNSNPNIDIITPYFYDKVPSTNCDNLLLKKKNFLN